MSRQGRVRRIGPAMEEARQRPLYARVLRLRHLNPGGMLCFVFLEGAFVLGLLLALAELLNWWGMLLLPVAVALMVKANDLVAGAVTRSAALVPEQERERFRWEVAPAIGHAVVPGFRARGSVRLRQSRVGDLAVPDAGGPEALDGHRTDGGPYPGLAGPTGVEPARDTAQQQAARDTAQQEPASDLAEQEATQGPPRQWSEPPDEADLWWVRQSGRRRYE